MRHLIGAAALLPALAAAPATGQAVLDWPLVLEARPAPLIGGAGAVLGNPAGLAALSLRAEGMVSDLETPEEMGLRGLTLAAAVRIVDGWNIGVAYRHLGVGDMLRTDGPPLGQATTPLEIGEDVFALGVGARLGGITAGLAARLDTPADELGGEESWAGTVGVGYAHALPYRMTVRLGGAAELARKQLAIAGGAEVGSPALAEGRLELALAYGGEHIAASARDFWRFDAAPLGVSHSLVASGTWARMFELQAGVSVQPGADERAWVPLLAGLLHLGRYRLGVVREHLPNGFGAAMHYRLSFAL